MDNYKIQSVLIKKKYFTLHEATMWVVEHGYNVKKVDETKKYYRFRQITPSTLRKNGYTDFRTIKLDNSHSSIELILAYHHLLGSGCTGSTCRNNRILPDNTIENDRLDDDLDPAGSRRNKKMCGGRMIGGKLSVENIQALLKASYQADPNDNINGFILDPNLSNADVKTYYNPSTGQAVVSHKGTQGTMDWGNNLVFGVGGEKAYKLTPRYKNSERIQKEAESKYGAKNVSTIGHSQGGLLAQMVGKNSKEIITYNKASSPFGSSATPTNQYDIRTTGDVVSGAQFLNPINWFGFASGKKGNEITIPSKATGVEAHDLEQFKYLDSNQMIGAGYFNTSPPPPHDRIVYAQPFYPEQYYLKKGSGRAKKIYCGGAMDKIRYNRNKQGFIVGSNGLYIPLELFDKHRQDYILDYNIRV